MKVSYPVDRFEKNDVSIGYHIFVLAADPSDYRVCRPPVSADPRIVGTDILKWVSSCLNIVPCIFRQHSYFKKLSDRVSQVSEHM